MLTTMAQNLASNASALHGFDVVIAAQAALMIAFAVERDRLTRLALIAALRAVLVVVPMWVVCEIAIAFLARPWWRSGIPVQALAGLLLVALPLKLPRHPRADELSDEDARLMTISGRTARVVFGTMLIVQAMLALVF